MSKGATWAIADSRWYGAAASVPAWIVLVSAAAGFVVPDICYSPSLPAADRFAVGLLVGLSTSHFWNWMLMVAAMMPPILYPMAQYVMVRGFRERRMRSLVLFLGSYGLVWALAFPGAVAVLTALATIVPRTAVGLAAFALAALVQLLPMTVRARQLKHRAPILSVYGIRADVAVLRCGVTHGALCCAVCAPMMIAAMATPIHLLAMVLTWPLMLATRPTDSPYKVGGMLLGAGVVVHIAQLLPLVAI